MLLNCTWQKIKPCTLHKCLYPAPAVSSRVFRNCADLVKRRLLNRLTCTTGCMLPPEKPRQLTYFTQMELLHAQNLSSQNAVVNIGHVCGQFDLQPCDRAKKCPNQLRTLFRANDCHKIMSVNLHHGSINLTEM